jgi:hypothetical protein
MKRVIKIPLTLAGKEYDIPNVGKIILYPIAKLSKALKDVGIPRDTYTIRKWERDKLIPPAIFRDEGNKRLYSQEQIDCLVEVALQCEIQRGVSFANSDFSKLVWTRLTEINKKYIGGNKNAS